MEMVLWVSQYDATIGNFLVVRTWFRVGRPGIWGVDQAPLPANFRNPVRIQSVNHWDFYGCIWMVPGKHLHNNGKSSCLMDLNG